MHPHPVTSDHACKHQCSCCVHRGHAGRSEETGLLDHVLAITCCEDSVLEVGGSHSCGDITAGMQATGPLVEQPLEYFQQVMDTNVTGPVRMTQAVVPAMLARVSDPSDKQHLLCSSGRDVSALGTLPGSSLIFKINHMVSICTMITFCPELLQTQCRAAALLSTYAVCLHI